MIKFRLCRCPSKKVVGYGYINIMKMAFISVLTVNKFFFLIISLQAIKDKLFKLTASLCFYAFEYPRCLKS